MFLNRDVGKREEMNVSDEKFGQLEEGAYPVHGKAGKGK